MKKILFASILFIYLVFLFGCGTKIYHLKCDPAVPKFLAESIESKNYVEGDNPLFGEGHSRVIVTINDGKIVGLKHKIGDSVLAIDGGDGDGPVVMTKCASDFVACTAACGPAPLDSAPNPERDKCLETCQLKYQLCLCKGGKLISNISIQ